MKHIRYILLFLPFTIVLSMLYSCAKEDRLDNVYEKHFSPSSGLHFNFHLTRASQNHLGTAFSPTLFTLNNFIWGYPGGKMINVQNNEMINQIYLDKSMYFTVSKPSTQDLDSNDSLVFFVANFNPRSKTDQNYYGLNKNRYESIPYKNMFPTNTFTISNNGQLHVSNAINPGYLNSRFDVLKYLVKDGINDGWRYSNGNLDAITKMPIDDFRNDDLSFSFLQLKDVNSTVVPLFGYAKVVSKPDFYGNKLISISPELIELKPAFARFDFYVNTAEGFRGTECYIANIPRFFYISSAVQPSGDNLCYGAKEKKWKISFNDVSFDKSNLNLGLTFISNPQNEIYNEPNRTFQYNGHVYPRCYGVDIFYGSVYLPAYTGYDGPYIVVNGFKNGKFFANTLSSSAKRLYPIVPFDNALTSRDNKYYTDIKGGHYYKVYIYMGYDEEVQVRVLDATTEYDKYTSGVAMFN